MEALSLIKEDVLAAFSNGRTGVPAAAAEFGINRAAIYQWPDGRQIPAERILHLMMYRTDIIQRVKEIQSDRLRFASSAKQLSTQEAAA